jgi:poly(3-hydroxybutyrate) depolymerase
MDQVLVFLESKGWGHSWQRQSHKVASYKHELEMDDVAKMMASARHMARRCNRWDSLSVDNDLSS